jgi:hypothetical protein
MRTCWASTAPSTLINILCEALRESNLLPSSGRLPELGAAQRNALVAATHYLLSVLAKDNRVAVVHVDSVAGEVLVTVVVTDGGAAPEPDDVVVVRGILTDAGGALRVDPEPFFELRIRSGPDPASGSLTSASVNSEPI